MTAAQGATGQDLLRRYREAVPSGLRVLHVATNGDDGQDGETPERAFRTPGAAAAYARAGDRLLIGPGAYPPIDAYGVTGAAGAWISIEAEDPSAPPLIDARATSSTGIALQGCAYVGLYALDLKGIRGADDDASGIAVFRGSRSVRVWGCRVDGFPGGGINCFWVPATTWAGSSLPAGGWDSVDVAFNEVRRCCWWSGWNASGISFFGGEVLTAELLEDGFGYRAIGNRVEDCRCLVPYRAGGLDIVTDGNGISVDALTRRNALTPTLGPYPRGGLVEGNVLVRNGGRGIHVFDTDGVLVFGNTSVENLQTDSPAFAGAADLERTGIIVVDAPMVCFSGNVVLPRAGRRAIAGAVERSGNVVLGGPSAPGPDLDRRHEGAAWFAADGDFVPLRPDFVADRAGSAGADVDGFFTRHGSRIAGARRGTLLLD